MERTEYLVDLVGAASIDSPDNNYVYLEKMILRREVETAIFQHPTSTVTLPPLHIGKRAMLSFGCGIKQSAWPHIKSPVRFSITVETERGRQKVFATRLDPRRRPEDRGWQRHELSLSRYEGQTVRVVLQTRVGWRHSSEYAWSGWANPRIVHDVAAPATRLRQDRHRHVFLITADALPARYLGCYGHPRVQTPHLDQLASEGVRLEQAWSQCCITFGSYVSLLTGTYPDEHGVAKEWDPFPVAQVSLPSVLAASGYHTLFASGSRELSGRNNRLDRVFNEVLPMLSNPMQDGALTTRQLIHWFEQRPERPCFSWVHYFDVHPPLMPPAPFNSMYYSEDPTDREQEYLSSEIGRIRAVESVLIIGAALPLLDSGRPVAEVAER